ncbi:MAG: nucleotidyltransferase family protein, partial [Prevotella sp.]|nr:nucleotidyltransferase family protein [Prevotella sp.]
MIYERYFEFLRFSLVDGCPVPAGIASMDWGGLYDFGVKQAWTGILFSGIKKLPADVAPKGKLFMQWFAMSDAIRRRNIKLNNAAAEIFRLFTSGGFRCCVLKGQGNALLYSDPYSRSSGDVDLWACGYADISALGGFRYPGQMGMLRKTLPFIKRHFSVNNVVSHHISFDYGDVEVEVHHTPSVIFNPVCDKRFQRWCVEQAPRMSGHRVALPDTGGGEIAVPTVGFNLIYQLDHVFH